jgi:hypothetical protein
MSTLLQLLLLSLLRLHDRSAQLSPRCRHVSVRVADLLWADDAARSDPPLHIY